MEVHARSSGSLRNCEPAVGSFADEHGTECAKRVVEVVAAKTGGIHDSCEFSLRKLSKSPHLNTGSRKLSPKGGENWLAHSLPLARAERLIS